MSPKAHVKGWTQKVLEGLGTFERWGLMGALQTIVRMLCKQTEDPSSLLFSPPMKWAALLHCKLQPWHAALPEAQNNRVISLKLDPPET
jgi:hypothetical protein